MALDESEIRAVQQILTAWNPLGDQAAQISDLNDYRTEAMDILNYMGFRGIIFRRERTATLVQDILEGAFKIHLRSSDCEDAGRRIDAIVKRRSSVEQADRGEPPDEPSFRAGI